MSSLKSDDTIESGRVSLPREDVVDVSHEGQDPDSGDGTDAPRIIIIAMTFLLFIIHIIYCTYI